MSVLSFVVDDLFVIRLVKYHSNNPDNKWVNNYEVRASESGDNADLIGLGLKLVAFEQALHAAIVKFDRMIISTWEEDSKPYDPEAFLTIPLTQEGLFAVTGDLLALDQTFSVTRRATSGRFGHLFYRGVLAEGDVHASAGKSILFNRTAMQTRIDDAIASSGLDEHIGAAPAESLDLVMVGKLGNTQRNIIQLVAQGVSSVPEDHAWFNRTTPAP